MTILSDQAAEEAAAVCSALAHETRMKIFVFLRGRPQAAGGCTVTEICEAIKGSDEVTVRHHIQKLLDTKMLRVESSGRQKFYTLHTQTASRILYQLSHLLWYPEKTSEETE